MLTDEELFQRFGKSRAELTRVADAHTLEVQAWLSSRSPAAAQFQGRGARASSTGFKLQFLNLALGCDFPAGTSAEEVEAEIEAVKEFFAKRNVPWYWWMSAKPAPANFGELLQKHGLEYDAPALPAMIASNGQAENSFPEYPPEIQVWQAETREDLRAASLIRRIAFRFAEGEALTYFEDMESDWRGASARARLFLAGRERSAAVAIGAVIEGAGVPGIYVMATLPEYHRQGYGKALMHRLMREAKSLGREVVVLTASKAGAGLYAQFGFVQIFGFDFYRLPEG